ncbi:MAG TPA: extracellular solute-binding protein [Pyrinomonadaceae bacterium]|nr:extracellular solute-binding protein [Pyrinomonadaceae bacterium]
MKKSYGKRALGIFLLSLCFLAVGASWSSAQDSHTIKLVEGAKKEGTVMLYTSMNVPDVNRLFDAFRRKYPFLSPQFYTTRSAALLQRIVIEAQAGRHSVDVIQANGYTVDIISKKGLTKKYASPESKTYPSKFRDPNGHWIATYIFCNVIGYNTKLLARTEAPRNYEDLLDPKWRGKMGLDDKQYIWFDGLLEAMGREKGLAFMKKLANQQIQFRSGNALMANLLAAGEFAILVNARPEQLDKLKRAGAPVAWTAPKPVTVNVLPVAIASQAPHPNAAALFTDYLLSAEGQTLLKEQAAPARPGIGGSDSCVSQSSEVFVNDISMEERFDEVVGLYKKIFTLP